MDDNPRISILLFAAGSAAIMVTIYHCIVVCWSNRQANNSQSPQHFVSATVETSSGSPNNSAAQFIPAHKYQKSTGLVGDEHHGGTCAVCLCEFEEGEELRTLPGCMHSFHVPCIDMWLHSHTSCPMCRSDATPSPSPLVSRDGMDLRSGESDAQSETLREIVVQSARRV